MADKKTIVPPVAMAIATILHVIVAKEFVLYEHYGGWLAIIGVIPGSAAVPLSALICLANYDFVRVQCQRFVKIIKTGTFLCCGAATGAWGITGIGHIVYIINVKREFGTVYSYVVNNFILNLIGGVFALVATLIAAHMLFQRPPLHLGQGSTTVTLGPDVTGENLPASANPPQPHKKTIVAPIAMAIATILHTIVGKDLVPMERLISDLSTWFAIIGLMPGSAAVPLSALICLANHDFVRVQCQRLAKVIKAGTFLCCGAATGAWGITGIIHIIYLVRYGTGSFVDINFIMNVVGGIFALVATLIAIDMLCQRPPLQLGVVQKNNTVTVGPAVTSAYPPSQAEC